MRACVPSLESEPITFCRRPIAVALPLHRSVINWSPPRAFRYDKICREVHEKEDNLSKARIDLNAELQAAGMAIIPGGASPGVLESFGLGQQASSTTAPPTVIWQSIDVVDLFSLNGAVARRFIPPLYSHIPCCLPVLLRYIYRIPGAGCERWSKNWRRRFRRRTQRSRYDCVLAEVHPNLLRPKRSRCGVFRGGRTRSQRADVAFLLPVPGPVLWLTGFARCDSGRGRRARRASTQCQDHHAVLFHGGLEPPYRVGPG